MRITLLGDSVNLEQGHGGDFSLDFMARLLTERGHDVTVATVNHADENAFPTRPEYDVDSIGIGDGASFVGVGKGIVDYMSAEEATTELFNIAIAPYVVTGGLYKLFGGTTPVVGRLNNYAFCSNHAAIDDHCFKNCTAAAKFSHSPMDMSGKISNIPRYLFDTYYFHRALNSMDGLYALSPAVRDIYAANGVAPENIEVVPNAFDPQFGQDSSPSRADQESASLLYVGRLQEQKGVDVLLSSLERIDSIDVVLKIVGDGPDRSALERQAAALNSDHDVEFLGYQRHDTLPELYSNSDIFVHPGRWPEPFNRTILESIQMGTIPIVSDIGGPPWVVDDERLVFDVEDPDSLAETIERLFVEGQYRDLHRHCQQRLEDFHPDVVGDDIETLFRRVVG